jgi:hypothetical protein
MTDPDTANSYNVPQNGYFGPVFTTSELTAALQLIRNQGMLCTQIPASSHTWNSQSMTPPAHLKLDTMGQYLLWASSHQRFNWFTTKMVCHYLLDLHYVLTDDTKQWQKLTMATHLPMHPYHHLCKARSEFVGECLMRMDDIGFGDYCFHRLRTDFRRFACEGVWFTDSTRITWGYTYYWGASGVYGRDQT